MTHKLTPLLAPRSVALVGASARPDTPGNDMVRMLARSGFDGVAFAVNPNLKEVEGLPCFPSIGALRQPVDLAILGVGNARLEQALREAAEAGARAAVIFASCYLENDREPKLTDRLAAIAREAGMALCGGNGMGFYNDAGRVWASPFFNAREPRPGPITFISHAGSPFGALAHNDPRFRFNLVISAGQELGTTTAEYMDYALEQPETRVIGLFLEAARDPERFVAALDKAARKSIPVVALKVGRTEASAALALSHSGAIAGNDAAWRALFDRWGVVQVDTIDELGSALLLFAQERRPAAGRGLAVIGDSGGERELIVDLAAALGVPFAKLGPATVERLSRRLEHGLAPVNPLDAWGTGNDFVNIFGDCFSALLEDEDAAMGLFFNDLRDGYYVHQGFAAACRLAFERTRKPVAYATNYTRVRNEGLSLALTEAGIPVLDGTIPALKAAAHMLAYRDFLARPADPPPGVSPARDWTARLSADGPLDEAEALDLLGDFGIATLPRRVVDSAEAAVAAAREIGFPVALKTAVPGVLHKTERGGVKLGLADEAAVIAAWEDLAHRLGPRVLVTRMAGQGVELALGATIDPQFGPVVMVAAGGVWVELLRDAAHALAPFGHATARRLLDRLRVRPLLDGMRGAAPVNLEGLADGIAHFSVLAATVCESIGEIDVNPLLATAEGPVALDALVIRRRFA